MFVTTVWVCEYYYSKVYFPLDIHIERGKIIKEKKDSPLLGKEKGHIYNIQTEDQEVEEELEEEIIPAYLYQCPTFQESPNVFGHNVKLFLE